MEYWKVNCNIYLFPWRLNLDKIELPIISFETILLVWIFQLSLSSIKIPKHLTWVVVYNHFLHDLCLSSVSNCLLLDLNKITSVLRTFNEILFAFNQRRQTVLSVLLICSMELCVFSKQVLSATWSDSDTFIAWWKSLIFIKIRSGPKTEPWGTS